MCQVGSLSNIKDNSYENKFRLEQVLKTMLIGMSESNKDGSGMAFAATDGRVFMTKSKNPGSVMAEDFSLDPDIDYKHFILHSRMATHGATTDENAHPHETKYGYLVHNGWCPSLYQKHKAEMKTGCDSEALAHIYEPDPELFEKALLGSEHFAIIHLDADGSNVRVANKNKMLYRAHSKVLSADIFLTSSSVIKEIGKVIGEDLDYKMVHDGETFVLDGETMTEGKFKFADAGYTWYGHGWSGNYHEWSHDRDLYKKFAEDKTPQKPIYYNRGKRKDDDSIPDHVFRMTRKERRRWIRDNKEKRDAYVQFWMEHDRELKEQEAQEKEFREDGFTILDADGNIINEG